MGGKSKLTHERSDAKICAECGINKCRSHSNSCKMCYESRGRGSVKLTGLGVYTTPRTKGIEGTSVALTEEEWQVLDKYLLGCRSRAQAARHLCMPIEKVIKITEVLRRKYGMVKLSMLTTVADEKGWRIKE